jgi:hypothetical protein
VDEDLCWLASYPGLQLLQVGGEGARSGVCGSLVEAVTGQRCVSASKRGGIDEKLGSGRPR